MTKNGCLFACEFLKQPSVFSFEPIGLAELMFGCQVGWGQPTCRIPDKPRWDQCKGHRAHRAHHRSVFSESCNIVVFGEKTISYDKKSRRHDNTIKTIQKRLKWFEYISNDFKLYFNNIGLHSGHSRFGQRLRQGREKEMLREQRELEGENRITTIDSCKQLSTAERKNVTVYIYIR